MILCCSTVQDHDCQYFSCHMQWAMPLLLYSYSTYAIRKEVYPSNLVIVTSLHVTPKWYIRKQTATFVVGDCRHSSGIQNKQRFKRRGDEARQTDEQTTRRNLAEVNHAKSHGTTKFQFPRAKEIGVHTYSRYAGHKREQTGTADD